MKRALGVVAAALLLPAAAAAHVAISPPFVEAGVETEISLAVPNERPPNATAAVRVTVPAGFEIVSANGPAGWAALVDGSTVTWTGGRIEARDEVTFPLRIVARTRAGTYLFEAVQDYDDGATARWTADLNVLPATGAAAPNQRPWAAIGAAIAGLCIIAGSLLGLRFLRRRSLQVR